MPESVAARFLDQSGIPFFPLHEPWPTEPVHVARVLRECWETICRETKTAKQVDELHEARDDIRSIFDRYISLFKDYVALLDLIEQMTNRNGPLPQLRERINREVEELTRLSGEIFSKWETVDDIAQVLIDKLPPLTPEQLSYIAKHNPPPQSWYDEDFDPFTPDVQK